MNVANPHPAVPKLAIRRFHLTPDRLAFALLLLDGLLLLFDRFRLLFPKGCAVLTAMASVILVMFVMLFWLAVALLSRSRFKPGIPALVFVLGRLALDGFALRSDSLRRLEFSDKTQWTVLMMALAAVGLTLLFILFCFAGGRFFRWRFQFNIRTLLLLVVVVAMPCSWMATDMKKAKEQATAVKAEGEWVAMAYDYELDGYGKYVGGRSKEPPWLRDLLGCDFFADVVAGSSTPRSGPYSPSLRSPLPGAALDLLKTLPRINWLELAYTQVTDTGLVSLKALHELEHLSLAKTEISDAGLEHLAGFTQLRSLDLRETRVTEEGVEKLRQALPKCKIDWEPQRKNERAGKDLLWKEKE